PLKRNSRAAVLRTKRSTRRQRRRQIRFLRKQIYMPRRTIGAISREFSRVARSAAHARCIKADIMSELVSVGLTVNGTRREARCEPRKLLADFLREDLGLTGTHVGCEHGVCGACTIHFNGEAVRSCIMLAVQADGAELRTIEGLAANGNFHPLQ